MSEIVQTVIARVRLVIDVPAGSSWGSNCTMSQIHDQAGRETAAKVERVLRDANIGVSFVEEPVVTAIMNTARKR